MWNIIGIIFSFCIAGTIFALTPQLAEFTGLPELWWPVVVVCIVGGTAVVVGINAAHEK